MKASQIAHEAAKLLDGDRDRTHGNKRDNHANIGALWSAYLSRALGVHVALRPSQVAARSWCCSKSGARWQVHTMRMMRWMP